LLQKDASLVKIYELVIEPGREEHIARHHVSVEEVEGLSLVRLSSEKQGKDDIISLDKPTQVDT